MFLLGTENFVGGGQVGIASLPVSITRGLLGVGGKKNTGPPDSRTKGSSPPTVLVYDIFKILSPNCFYEFTKKNLNI